MFSNKDIAYLTLCIAGAIEFSTCAKRQYYAIIIDNYGHQIGSGYNGAPKRMSHCSDGGCPRLQENSKPGTVYDNCISLHAEANSILHSNYTDRRDGGTIYINGNPCWDCAKLIANSGLTKIVHIDEGSERDFYKTLNFLNDAHIEVVSIPLESLYV